MELDIVCALGPRSLEHLGFLEWTARALKSDSCDLNFKVVRSGLPRAQEIPEGFSVLGEVPPAKCGSFLHGSALNFALDHIQTEYVLFADVDAAILIKDWDKYFIDILESSDDIAVAGTAYPAWLSQYQKFPNVILAMFKTSVLKELRPDFTPEIVKNHVVRRHLRPDELGYYKLSKNRKGLMKCDTGFRLPKALGEAGYHGVPFRAYRCVPPQCRLPIVDLPIVVHNQRLCMNEYRHDGNLIATHLGESRDKGAKNKLTRIWRKRIRRYLIKRGLI